MSGTSCLISNNAEEPSSAERTLSPKSVKSSVSDSLADTSSSTIMELLFSVEHRASFCRESLTQTRLRNGPRRGHEKTHASLIGCGRDAVTSMECPVKAIEHRAGYILPGVIEDPED